MALNQAQRDAARKLLAERPTVLGGTRAILNDRERKHWFDKVATTMLDLQVSTSADVNEFCDIAGVPD